MEWASNECGMGMEWASNEFFKGVAWAWKGRGIRVVTRVRVKWGCWRWEANDVFMSVWDDGLDDEGGWGGVGVGGVVWCDMVVV